VSDPTVLILAAGEGTRMRSVVPKVLHPLCGRPLIAWPVAAARDAGAARIVVIDGAQRRLADQLPEGVELAVQEQPLGTGDAVRAAREHIEPQATVVVLMGDVPLITAEVVGDLVQTHEQAGAAATMMTMELADPAGYGRVVRGPDGSVERVVETKTPGDASEAELAIREVNTGIYAFTGEPLLDALEQLTPQNVQGELYLPDVLPILRGSGREIAAHPVDDPDLTLGVNDKADLAAVRKLAQERIAREHMLAGVTIVDPATTIIDVDVAIGRDAVIEPGSALKGTTTVGAEAAVGPHSTLTDTSVGERAAVVHSFVVGARIDDGATVGPFAYLRPGAHLHEGAKAGTFVELKNAEVHAGAKVPHLSYLGDAEVGEGSNVGAGSITANYDGLAKHRTTIGKDVRLGVDTALVAPVTVGDGAYTAAGSAITEDVPPGALGVARERQRNVDGYSERIAERRKDR
jgi:bifunctional UDP-N-acetylglucosamine pyrophosphorylase / glucosamine-1-phosphate N-acetyltransferase